MQIKRLSLKKLLLFFFTALLLKALQLNMLDVVVVLSVTFTLLCQK